MLPYSRIRLNTRQETACTRRRYILLCSQLGRQSSRKLRNRCVSMNEVAEEQVRNPLNDFFTWPHITNKIHCLKFNTRGSPEVLVQQDWTCISTAIDIFPLTTKSVKLREGAKNMWDRQKGPVSKHQWNTSWFTAVPPSSLYVTKQNETFRGHYSDVKEFWASLGALRQPTICFLEAIFQPIDTAHKRGKFPPQMYTSLYHLLSPHVCFLLLFFQLKNLSNRATNSLIIEIWGVFLRLNWLALWLTAITFLWSDNSQRNR